MKCALFRGLVSSETGGAGCVGKKPLMRLRMPVCVGAGRLRIDFPGIGIVTAEDEGEQDEEETMSEWVNESELAFVVGACIQPIQSQSQ